MKDKFYTTEYNDIILLIISISPDRKVMKHETKTNIVSHNKNKIKKTALKEVGLKMGYQSEEKVLRTMSAFLKSKSMYDRLSSGHYDLKYIADQFVGKLCSILNLSPNLLKE